MSPEEARRWLKRAWKGVVFLSYTLAVRCKPLPIWTLRVDIFLTDLTKEVQ